MSAPKGKAVDKYIYEQWLANHDLVKLLKEVRPAVLRFAFAMEETLRRHDHKGGWDNCEPTWLMKRVRQEVTELGDALTCYLLEDVPRRRQAADDVRGEATDVANFAMMLLDVCGELPRIDETFDRLVAERGGK